MQNTGIAAVICAAGSSKRMHGQKKEYLKLPSQPNKKAQTKNPLTVLGSSVSAFARCDGIFPIVIVLTPGDESAGKSCIAADLLAEDGRILFVSGGKTRRASVYNALSFLEPYKPSMVLLHDGARPWIERGLIERIIEAVKLYDAAIPALPIIETPKELSMGSSLELDPMYGSYQLDPLQRKHDPMQGIKRHLRREAIWTAQTPQGFKFPEILRAHEKAKEREEKDGFEYTDDAEVWGEFMGQVAVISGDPANKKITYPEDLK